MKCFHCDHCQQLVFFENFKCVRCNHTLAYLPGLFDVASLEKDGDTLWRVKTPGAENKRFRLCENSIKHSVCNWAVPEEDPNPFCESCRLTRIIPDLTSAGNMKAWFRLESAKRRLIYSLMLLKLPIASKIVDPKAGLAFEFKGDPPDLQTGMHVMTGHDEGVITINIAEANDVEREKRRNELFEPYRTTLGHMRHEIGHYYWDRLIAGSPQIDEYRKLFGDERKDYNTALKEYYAAGAPANWQDHYISMYSTAHPWEDWAESWAHYLHMVDALETAADTGLALKPKRMDEPAFSAEALPITELSKSFDHMIERWVPLTYVLNNLNRGLGLIDGYPFVLSLDVVEKLRFIHDIIVLQSQTSKQVAMKIQEPVAVGT